MQTAIDSAYSSTTQLHVKIFHYNKVQNSIAQHLLHTNTDARTGLNNKRTLTLCFFLLLLLFLSICAGACFPFFKTDGKHATTIRSMVNSLNLLPSSFRPEEVP
uniref:Uncharacterized protein n=1 Tax=Trypanosoma congolense (strain IL3000) TaxID=1068625 RepID=G0UZ28_TRYCI|nr:hypothetical protein, unlikely [Trypanosoma congolense IL3000]